MSWQCRLVDRQAQIEAGKRPQTGDMWLTDALPITNHPGRYFCAAGRLSEEYVRDHMAIRKPIVVLLPSGDAFSPDSAVTGDWHGWTVTGETPNITVSPSINYVGRYHGWLQNGVLSDDCEGRRF